MKLVKMSQKDFEVWAPRSKRSYAEDKARANNLTKNEAEEIAEKDFLRLLPDGLNSKDNFLYSIRDSKSNHVGYAWFCTKGPKDNRKAFICDIIIEEKFRGQGFGRGAMLLIESEAKNRDLKEIGLHVFGFNERAIHLYQSLGYLTTDLVMAKPL